MVDFLGFPEDSRVWIFASDKRIDDSKISDLYERVQQFVQNWSSHGTQLRASGGVIHNYFVILMVDEDINKPGGCSIDSSVHFIKSLENEFQLHFFDRQLLYYIFEDEVKVVTVDELTDLYKSGGVKNDTLFFDLLVKSKSEFNQFWLKPLQNSWHRKFVQI
ncbi:MAG: hypothetical protein IPQ10_00525 [Saprospiraceae bacterium]|jgi:hypothetical protein|nr:hypothetical protein [Saprospiraceae bacterium]MBK7797052.1 hypothetical protein [Saprospiraceae bacterium]MBK8152138.1 hypothetical protein [Saprospiraceae bacterium]MBK9377465.1 hypothetical protein [Saprospiraceae bacterium]MBL0259556.1 hypothetical protein [Saprospiraceae bacterium]